MLCDSRDPLVKNAQPPIKNVGKWMAKIGVEDTESTLKMKGIIGTVTGKWKNRSVFSATASVIQGVHYKNKEKWFRKTCTILRNSCVLLRQKNRDIKPIGRGQKTETS